MNRYVKLLVILCLPVLVAAQEEGIAFNHGSWTEVMKKAKEENKLIFIDVYTTWCGPCKQMVKEIFPQKDVAEKFNASFINYKLDAEKGEGIDIAKKYSVVAFPTYLFVNGDGKLYYRSTGSMPKENFLKEAGVALEEFKDPKPLAQWDEEYATRKKDKQFLYDYIVKRTKSKQDNSELIEQYMALTSEKELLTQKDRLKVLMGNDLIRPGGRFFKFRLARPKEIAEAVGSQADYVSLGLMNNLYFYMKKMLEQKDEKMLKYLTEGTALYPAGDTIIAFTPEEVTARYYTAIKQQEKLVSVLVPYMEKKLLVRDLSGIKRKDSEALARLDDNIKSGKIDTSKWTPEDYAFSRKSAGSGNQTNYAYKVRDMAKLVFEVIDDKEVLKKALIWVEHAKKYSQNFTMDETYGHLLYKLGDREGGIRYMQKAMDTWKSMGSDAMGITDRLNKGFEAMQKGEKTWK